VPAHPTGVTELLATDVSSEGMMVGRERLFLRDGAAWMRAASV
jgi:hypothetical protein